MKSWIHKPFHGADEDLPRTSLHTRACLPCFPFILDFNRCFHMSLVLIFALLSLTRSPVPAKRRTIKTTKFSSRHRKQHSRMADNASTDTIDKIYAQFNKAVDENRIFYTQEKQHAYTSPEANTRPVEASGVRRVRATSSRWPPEYIDDDTALDSTEIREGDLKRSVTIRTRELMPGLSVGSRQRKIGCFKRIWGAVKDGWKYWGNSCAQGAYLA
jgi:hypothetical protein